MITRETTKKGTLEIDVEGEIPVEGLDGQKIFIPFNHKWKSLLVQVSGGLDSSLLLFLTSKMYKENGIPTKILPLSLEIESKAKSLENARKIISGVREKLDAGNILEGVEYLVPGNLSKNPHKNRMFKEILVKVFTERQCSFEFNGNTKNPPKSARADFHNDEKREIGRDSRSTIYNGLYSASPLSLVDKKTVVYLHKKHGLFEGITKYTVSCDMATSVIIENEWGFPCQNCWWCCERSWGFKSNDVQDPAPNPVHFSELI